MDSSSHVTDSNNNSSNDSSNNRDSSIGSDEIETLEQSLLHPTDKDPFRSCKSI
jgi:hypothetical protein